MDCILKIAKVPTDVNDKPRIPVHITSCGLEGDYSDSEDEPEEDKNDDTNSNHSDVVDADNSTKPEMNQKDLLIPTTISPLE